MHCCTVRLACLIHAASVRSEPGSNSPYKNYFVADKFVCAFFTFSKKLNSRSIQIFLIKTQQCLHHCLNLTRAIRTIQFFKEHRIFSIRCISFTQLHFKAEQRVLNISRLSDFSSGIRKIFHFSFIRNFAFPDSPVSILSLMIIAVLRREV